MQSGVVVVEKRAAKAVVAALTTPSIRILGPHGNAEYPSEVIERATLTGQTLLTWAIVNMSKGIAGDSKLLVPPR